MLEVIIDPAVYVQLVAGLMSNQPQLRLILPKIALFFDKVHVFGEVHRTDVLEQKPYATFSAEVTEDVFKGISAYSPPTEEQLRDLKKALGDKQDSEGGNYAYLLMRSLLDIASRRSYFFYIFPDLRDDFISFCLKYQPKYLKPIKESFMLFSILECVFEEEIPAFDPIQSKKTLLDFSDYKEDFQNGLLKYLSQFVGGYTLSEDQRAYLKEDLANQEKRLIDFLRPENLKKYNISKLDLTVEGASMLSPIPLPLGTIVNVGREIKKVHDFKKSNLEFILSLFILKKMTNVGKMERTLNCAVCALSMAEIDKMSEEQCFNVMYKSELCIQHMVGRIDLRKRFRLYGKPLLKELKRLGDSSVFIES